MKQEQLEKEGIEVGNAPIFKIGQYDVFRKRGKFVVKVADCDICQGPCRVTELSASKSDIKRVMAGKLDDIGGYSVTLYPKTVKIGCTRVRKSKLERLLK